MIRVFVLGLMLAVAASAQASSELKYNPKADPRADLKAALAQASKDGKNVLLDVGGEWCIWCHRMDKFIADHEELHSLVEKNYVLLKVNFSDENKNEAFLAGYPKVAGYPHVFVLDAQGKLLESKNTGDLEEGKGYNLERFTEFLKSHGPKK